MTICLSSETFYLGIDPGKKGALALINGDLSRIKTWMMPMREVLVGGNRRKHIDGCALDKILKGCLLTFPLKAIVVEHLWSRPSDTPMTAWALSDGCAHCHQALESLDLGYHLVSPLRWKGKVMGDKANWVGNKQASIEYIQKKYPHMPLRLGKQRTDQDGIADALCLALYGRAVHG